MIAVVFGMEIIIFQQVGYIKRAMLQHIDSCDHNYSTSR